ncbi:hypothetical protein R1flu_026373 [Riccia fluitans]|uniref:Aminotransferase class V domain-containing protein n=1 Tax=Riccia fluitans TaxID=41844 RepID=A0ABD1XFT8_9MARC
MGSSTRVKQQKDMKVSKRFAPTKWKNSKQRGEEQGVILFGTQGSKASGMKSHQLPRHLERVSPEQKLEWLRSQIIGRDIECLTPFGKRLVHYADHTASGRSLMFIENYIIQKVLPVYGNTHTDDSYVGQRTTFLVEQATHYVKKCLGGTDDDAIFFCGTGTTGAIKKLQEFMGVAVTPLLREQILQSMEERKRWVVFVGPYEHHSNLLSWRQSLAEVVEIPSDEYGFIDMDELEAAVRNPSYEGRPKLGSFSACSNVTGIITNTRALGRFLHAHGCLACFDFAASGPYVEVDMRSGQADGYDAVFLSPHKFVGGPGTSGVLLMRKKLYLLSSGPPSTCGGGTVDFVNQNEKETIYYANTEKREDAGTPGILQKIRTGLTFWTKEVIGTELILSRQKYIISAALRRLSINPKIIIHGSTKAKRIAILSFNIETTLSPKPHPGLSGYSSTKRNIVAKERASPLRIFLRAERRNHMVEPGDDRGEEYFDECHIMQGKPLHGRFITKLLNDLFGIQGRGGCSCAAVYGHQLFGINSELSLGIREAMQKGWGGLKPGWARVSFGFYITQEEFEFMLAAIEFIAEYGQRFLQLYDFDWKTGDWTFKEECKCIVERAEKQVASTRKQHWWSLRPESSEVASCFVTQSNRSLIRSLNPEKVSYFQLAECLVQLLPRDPAPKEIPHGLDPDLLTFRV